MKSKTLKLTAILLIIAGIFTACNEKEPPIEPFLNIDKTTITAPAEGGVFHIVASSSGNWTAVVQDVEDNSWLTLIKASASATEGMVSVDISKNPCFTMRSATIKIVMGNLSEVVVVEQVGLEEHCEDYPREISFTQYLIPWQCLGRLNSDEYAGRVVVVNCEEEFARHFRCPTTMLPEIDFSKHSLLLAQGIDDRANYAVPISLTQTSAQNFVMEVSLIPMIMPIRAGWKSAVLIERISNNINIELITTTKDVPEHSVWRTDWQGSSYIELTFYPSINKVQVQTYPNPMPSSSAIQHFFAGSGILEYYITDDRMHFPFIDTMGNLWTSTWIISYPAENEMRLDFVGGSHPSFVRTYNFILQTKFREK